MLGFKENEYFKTFPRWHATTPRRCQGGTGGRVQRERVLNPSCKAYSAAFPHGIELYKYDASTVVGPILELSWAGVFTVASVFNNELELHVFGNVAKDRTWFARPWRDGVTLTAPLTLEPSQSIRSPFKDGKLVKADSGATGSQDAEAAVDEGMDEGRGQGEGVPQCKSPMRHRGEHPEAVEDAMGLSLERGILGAEEMVILQARGLVLERGGGGAEADVIGASASKLSASSHGLQRR